MSNKGKENLEHPAGKKPLAPKLRFPEFHCAPAPMPPLSSVAKFVSKKIEAANLSRAQYISTENLCIGSA
jgi:hypothetical protein